MLNIAFYSDSDLDEDVLGAAEYRDIWSTDGEKIVQAWKASTGFDFREKEINAIAFKGISHSNPLSLRSNLTQERKKSVLVHELGHRILSGRFNMKEYTSLEGHKTLFLVLHDILLDLYGKKFLDETIEWDKNLPRDEYKQAWEWVLGFDKNGRKEEFSKRVKK